MKLALLASQRSIHTVKWVNEMASRGHQVHLLTMHPPGDALHKDIQVYPLLFPPTPGYFMNVIQVRNILNNIEPDLLHSHYASGYGTLGRLSGFHPFVLSVWGDDVYGFPYRSFLNRWLVIGNLRTADWVCSTSQVMAEQTWRLCPDIKDLTVTPFGIEIDTFCPEPEQHGKDTITIGTVKTLTPKYGIDVLIHAFGAVYQTLGMRSPDIAQKLRLLIVGGGPQKAELEALAVQLGLNNITTFVGAVPHSDVPHYLNRLDIYVAASRCESESFGVAALEASACGLPVVVSDVGGLAEVTENEVTGLVVKKENVSAFAQALLQLIEDEKRRFPDLCIE